VALTLVHRSFVTFVSWMVLQARPDRAKEIEILVLRHQLIVLQSRTPRPRLRWTTERSSPRWLGCCRPTGASACWSRRQRSCAGIANSSTAY